MPYIPPKSLIEKEYYYQAKELFYEEEPRYSIQKTYVQNKCLYKNSMVKELILHSNGITRTYSSIGLLGSYFFTSKEDAQEFVRKIKIEYHETELKYHKYRIKELKNKGE